MNKHTLLSLIFSFISFSPLAQNINRIDGRHIQAFARSASIQRMMKAAG